MYYEECNVLCVQKTGDGAEEEEEEEWVDVTMTVTMSRC